MLDSADRLRHTLEGRYEIERLIGRGGMATVHLARDLRHSRRVAIKVLRAELAVGLAADRFRAEIEIAAALTHPNILPVFDSGAQDDQLYYVMPYVEGESLRARMTREGRLPIDHALRIAREVADALAYAHGRNVVHRDIKPENILLVEGHAVVTDFGIARAIAQSGTTRLTSVGLAVGTPLYMSPEQASGEPDVDGRSDVYALGAVLYEMLGGTPPHPGDTPQQVLSRKLTTPARPITESRSEIPRPIDAAIAKALEPDPANRWASATEFSHALGRPSRMVYARHWLDGRRRWLIAAGVAAVALIAAGYVATKNREQRMIGDDGRIGVVVLPFKSNTPQTTQWVEAIPDLLATALDGTPGVRVADPWAIWRSLRDDPHSVARSPDPAEGATLASRARACCYILGSLSQLQDSVAVTIRIYRRGGEEAWQTLAVAGSPNDLADLVRRISVEVIRRLSLGTSPLTPAQFDRGMTRSPNALKAWLAAREHQRRGRVDSAAAAIDSAIKLDSNFVLALVDAGSIKSWAQFQNGQPYSGLRELAERSVALSDSLPERPRLRAEAMLASINTQGLRSADALEHLLAADSLDLDAWSLLSYVHLAYGWQYGRREADALAAAERALLLDTTSAPALVRRLYLALALNDVEDVDHQLRRMRAVDTTSTSVHAMLRAVQALRAADDRFAGLAAELATAPIPEWLTVFRVLRTYRPDRAEQVILNTRRIATGQLINVATGAQVQLYSAQGRWRAIDSLRKTGAFKAIPGFDRTVDRLSVAAVIAGVGDDELARSAVERFAADIPPDSARAFLEKRSVWLDGWLVGAYHAMYADTSMARRWITAMGTLPSGGSPREYAKALKADITSRLAARQGQRDSALAQARVAYDFWDVHTENQFEFMPEPAIRFNLATLLRAAGKSDSAAALFRSLVPPVTWMGFYTARGALELGELEEALGDRTAAQRHLLTTQILWERGDPAISALRDRMRRTLVRVGEAERRR